MKRAEAFDASAGLRWASDCVEHVAEQIGPVVVGETAREAGADVQEHVARCLALARAGAAGTDQDAPRARTLRAAVRDVQRKRTPASVRTGRSTGGWYAAMRGTAGPRVRKIWYSLPGEGLRGLDRRKETQRGNEWEGAWRQQGAVWLLLDAACALLDDDAIDGAVRAARLCRLAAQWNKHAADAFARVGRSEFVTGHGLMRDIVAARTPLANNPGELAKVQGAAAEAVWQMARLQAYLELLPAGVAAAASSH